MTTSASTASPAMPPKRDEKKPEEMREEQELTDLIELLSLEDASEKIADRDRQSLAGYFKHWRKGPSSMSMPTRL